MAINTIHRLPTLGSFKITTLSESYSITSGQGVASVTLSESQNGWMPIAIAGGRTGAAVVSIYVMKPQFAYGSVTINMNLKNNSSSSTGDRTASLRVLWAR